MEVGHIVDSILIDWQEDLRTILERYSLAKNSVSRFPLLNIGADLMEKEINDAQVKLQIIATELENRFGME